MWAWKEPDARRSAEIKIVYEVNELRLLRSSAWLFIRTDYLGQAGHMVRAPKH